MTARENQENRTGNNWTRLGGWLVLASCLAAFLVYGVFRLTESPRIETVTTHLPESNSNESPVHDVGFRGNKRTSRR